MAIDQRQSRRRDAVIGLGMIGRVHARLLQASDPSSSPGRSTPAGIATAVHEPGLIFASIEDLVGRGPRDFAIVSVPTELHLETAERLAAAGVSMRIEKPLAATSDAARQFVETCRREGVHGAVGHVERFNPALQELARRLLDGQIGRLFTASTIRRPVSRPRAGRRRDQGSGHARHRSGERRQRSSADAPARRPAPPSAELRDASQPIRNNFDNSQRSGRRVQRARQEAR